MIKTSESTRPFVTKVLTTSGKSVQKLKLFGSYYFQLETLGGRLLIMGQQSSGRTISGALAFKTCCESRALTDTLYCLGCGSKTPFEKPYLRYFNSSWQNIAQTGEIWTPDDVIIDYLTQRFRNVDALDAIMGADEILRMLRTVVNDSRVKRKLKRRVF